MAIQSKTVVRKEIRDVADRAYSKRNALPSSSTVDSDDERKAYSPLFAEDNRQLIEVLLPMYRKMVSHFTENMMYCEPSTRTHHAALVRFVDIWDRFVGGTLPDKVRTELNHREKELYSFYDELTTQHDRLAKELGT